MKEMKTIDMKEMKTIDMKEAMRLVAEGTTVSAAQRHALQQQRLRELVGYAREHSPWFAQHYADVPDDFTLTDLPYTEKATLLEHYNDWVTDRELTLDGVLDYVARQGQQQRGDQGLLLGRYSALCTSGSTGNPLPMVRDDYHNKIHGAMMMQRLYNIGDQEILNISRHKVASVIHTSPNASSYNGYLRTLAQFPQAAGNMMALSVLDSIDDIVRRLNDFQPEVLSGYASSLLLLAVEKEKGNLDIPVRLVTNSAELLTDDAYERISKAFGCPVINNYCMTEGGEIAMTNGCRHLHLNEDWVIVEPVDAQKRPMPVGSEAFSEGIFVTDLSNFVQPIIRYYVTDRVRITFNIQHSTLNTHHSCSPLPILQIDGRVMEPFTLCGKSFTMAAIVTKAEVWKGLLKYQMVQTGPASMQVRGVCTADADADSVLGSLAECLQAYFRESGCTEAVFTYSKEPLLHNAKGGKIPRYVKMKDEK